MIWLPTPNLWRYLKCIVFTKTPVPSLSLLSLSSCLFSVSLHVFLPHPRFLSFSLSLAYISICPLAGLRKKGLHEQALCHSGRVHQCAECARWSGLLWREDKEVSRKPAPRHPARSALLRTSLCCCFGCVFFFFLPLWPVPFASITEYNLVPLSRINASVTPNPGEQIERLLVFMSTISYLTLHYLLPCRY